PKLPPMGVRAHPLAGHVSFGLTASPAPPRPKPTPGNPTPAAPVPVPAPVQPTSTRLLPRANPLLAIRFRVTLLPAPVTRFLARLLIPLFFGPVVVLALIGFALADVWFFRQASLSGAVESF